ncbi:SCP2 sterol-binding domain-containing protein [Hyaloraphidium curvatum]|nr:SCP2 sterol-binding domain-containing protein [Hyaloraphidium curvatum]
MSFASDEVFKRIGAFMAGLSAEERAKQVEKTKGVFLFEIKNKSDVKKYYIDLKKEGKVVEGDAPDADVTIQIKDVDMVDLASGKLDAQKAFMMGALNVEGNIMLAMKLSQILQAAGPAAKL